MNRQSLPLQLEMLRLRGELERTQIAEALVELRTSTRRIGAVATALANLRGARAGWLGAALEVLGTKAKWAPFAVLALRSARRHPVAAAVVAAAALAAVGWAAGGERQHKRRASEEGEVD